MPKFKTQDFEMSQIEGEDIHTACNMQLEGPEDPEKGLDLRQEYSSTLYGAKEMGLFFDNFLHYFTNVIKHHHQPICEVGAKEVEHLNHTFWNAGHTENTWDNAFIIDKISEVARSTPKSNSNEDSHGNLVTYESLIS